ncbi:gamma-glutamylcyclotransferase family protein [Luteolibacter soli]|uniref:Gamma-glutamylcyclotransferase family protein n=1 Tax=Luteolibacter soli TaxID=3135280 RepID=A0ABU9AXG0_9BACT
MSGSSSELVFVYGPLRRGGSEAYCMKSAEFVAEGRVAGALYHLPEGPGLVDGEMGSPSVRGELYQMSADKLQRLDELDGLDAEERERSDRRRRRVMVHSLLDDGYALEAWTWVWLGPVDPARWIQSGDWMKEYRPDFSERLRRYPWFTLIGMICVSSSPLWMLAAPITGYYKTPMAGLVRDALVVGAALSPFAAVFSLWLARRRGERDGLLGCFFVVAMAESVLAIFGLLAWLVQTIRR